MGTGFHRELDRKERIIAAKGREKERGLFRERVFSFGFTSIALTISA